MQKAVITVLVLFLVLPVAGVQENGPSPEQSDTRRQVTKTLTCADLSGVSTGERPLRLFLQVTAEDSDAVMKMRLEQAIEESLDSTRVTFTNRFPDFQMRLRVGGGDRKGLYAMSLSVSYNCIESRFDGDYDASIALPEFGGLAAANTENKLLEFAMLLVKNTVRQVRNWK